MSLVSATDLVATAKELAANHKTNGSETASYREWAEGYRRSLVDLVAVSLGNDPWIVSLALDIDPNDVGVVIE